MAINTRKLKRLSDGEIFRGVKVTAKNYVKAKDWVGVGAEALQTFQERKGGFIKQRVKVKTPKGPRVAQIGDYIVKAGVNTFTVVKAAEFADVLEEVK